MLTLCKGKEKGAQYIIRAALREEVNDGWVWVDDFQSRTVIKIKNLETGRNVICQARKFDRNFINRYNNHDGKRINMETDYSMTIVMSGWYREALGISHTTSCNNETDKATLTVCPYKWWLWGQLRAVSHHPDIVVRLGTRLGALGAWLGLLGAVLGSLSLIQVDGCFKWLPSATGCVTLAVSLVLLILGCRGPKSPQKT